MSSPLPFLPFFLPFPTVLDSVYDTGQSCERIYSFLCFCLRSCWQEWICLGCSTDPGLYGEWHTHRLTILCLDRTGVHEVLHVPHLLAYPTQKVTPTAATEDNSAQKHKKNKKRSVSVALDGSAGPTGSEAAKQGLGGEKGGPANKRNKVSSEQSAFQS